MDNVEKQQLRPRLYSEAEAQSILNRAMGLAGEGREFSHDHLVQMAEELGISAAQLQSAEEAWLAEQEIHADWENFLAYRREEWKKHLTAFIFVNTFLLLLNLTINYISGFSFYWFLFPLLGWGLGLAFDTWNTFRPSGEDLERDFERWQRKRERRQARRKLRSKTKEQVSRLPH